MKLNAVLRNESRLSVRNFKFSLLILIYTGLLSLLLLLIYRGYNNTISYQGLKVENSIYFYIAMVVIQAILLLFIVPSLTSTAICSEREKQTLDILLSTRLTPFQIIIGKVLASSMKVILLIICTIPLYAICSLYGGVRITNILSLIGTFIINTLFVSSIGILVSTYTKTSRVATTLTYGIVLFMFIGNIIISAIIVLMVNSSSYATLDIFNIPFMYFSPVTGFVVMILSQVGMEARYGMGYTNNFFQIHADIICIIIQIVLSYIFILLATRKLNPLKNKK